MAGVVYECGECGERLTERRCPDCNLFTRRLGPGGPCPACDELVLIQEITEAPDPLALSHTDNLTSSAAPRDEFADPFRSRVATITGALLGVLTVASSALSPLTPE